MNLDPDVGLFYEGNKVVIKIVNLKLLSWTTLLKVVLEVIKGVSNILDPYPHLNGGQQLGALEACLSQTIT